MFGTVEIYADYGTPKETLLHRESNLVVDGAGETICDMWSLPSGVANSMPRLTDSSNFTVQAISFGKGEDAYKQNAHFYPTQPSSTLIPQLPYYTFARKSDSDNIIRAPKLQQDENITYSVCSYDPQRLPGKWPSPMDTQLEPNTETAIDVVSGQYHTMHDTVMQGRAHAVGHNLNKLPLNTNPNLFSYTDSPLLDLTLTDGVAVANEDVFWTSGAGVKTMELSSFNSGPIPGLSGTKVSGAGNMTIRQEVSAACVFPKVYFHPNVDHTFSLYVNKDTLTPPHSVVLNMRALQPNTARGTRQDQKLQFWLSSTPPIWDRGYSEAFGVGAGGCSGHVTDVGNNWYRLEAREEGLGAGLARAGDYMKCIATFAPSSTGQAQSFFTAGWQLEERFGASQYRSVASALPSFEEGGISGDMFLGCYPHTSGTSWAIVSSLQDMQQVTDLENTVVSGIYPSSTGHSNAAAGGNGDFFFNCSTVRSMDSNGFVRAYNPLLGELGDSTSGLIVSAFPAKVPDVQNSFSSTGEVIYHTTISSGDLGLANLYGGIYKLGLWTIDLENTLGGNLYTEKLNTPLTSWGEVSATGFRFSTGANRLRYRLFAEKNFNMNIARIKDKAAAGDSSYLAGAGSHNYSHLTIVWKINFGGRAHINE